MWKVFTVKEVRVQGNKLYSAEQIQELVLNDEYSWNSLYVVGKYNFKEPSHSVSRYDRGIAGSYRIPF